MKRRSQDDKQTEVRQPIMELSDNAAEVLLWITYKLEHITLMTFVVVGLFILMTRT